jgi:hypothetical protein
MTQELQYTPRSSLVGASTLSDEEIRERHLKHIAEITNDLAPPKFANLTEDQQDFLDRKGRYAPYRPTRNIEEEDDEEW